VLIAEADAFVAQWKDSKLPDGRDRVVRHGHDRRRGLAGFKLFLGVKSQFDHALEQLIGR
jgi:hypothetical protein